MAQKLNSPEIKKAIKPFTQHGFIPKGMTDSNQVYGICPFKGGNKAKFFINVLNRKWDSKISGRDGGYRNFLEQMSGFCQKKFKGEPAEELAKERSLSIKTLKKYSLGYNQSNDTYNFPVYSPNDSKMTDLRYFRMGGKIYSTAGAKLGIFGWENHGRSDKIWLCEGEWDKMALDEVLTKKNVRDLIYSVPGAGAFKDEWVQFFADKSVRVLYDHDEAGGKGSLKVFNKIKPVTKKLTFVNWPEEYSDGFDVRDFYRLNKRKKLRTYKKLIKLFKQLPSSASEETKKALEGDKSKNRLTGKGLDVRELHKKYRKWLHLKDTDILDAIYAVIIANRLPGDPLWMFLVAPPGGTKSELLMSMGKAPKIFPTTSLTPHSLISGFPGSIDPSLIPKLNGKVLIIKDFTTILNLPIHVRDEIFGILRDAYDGKTEKQFGNNVTRRYESTFGVIAGVTPAIEIYSESNASLGERFLMYKMNGNKKSEERELIRRAMGNVAKEDLMRNDLEKVSNALLNYDYRVIPEVPEKITERVIHLAQWTSILRGTINRDRYTKEVTHRPFIEIGTRLSKQFIKFLLGRGMLYRKEKIDEEDYQLLKKIAISTAPSRNEELIRMLHKRNKDERFTIRQISEMIRLPSVTTQRIVENLCMLKAMSRKSLRVGIGIGASYHISKYLKTLIKGAQIYV